MKCPKCGGEHVEVYRETLGSTSAVFGSGVAHRGLFAKNKVHGLGTSAQRMQYQTTELCHDCGYSWHPIGQDEESSQKLAKGCLIIFLVIFIAVFLPVACSSKKSYASPADSTSSGSDAPAASVLWAASVTPLEDFEIELRDNVIYLEQYQGDASQLRIASQYELNGSAYPVCLDELELMGNQLESVILEDGITRINRIAFNSTGLQRLYLPASMTLIYDDMLAYVDDSLELIEYGGCEENWNSIYQHYEAPSVEEALDAEDYEAVGSALAMQLNNALGHEIDLSDIEIRYNVALNTLE